MSAFLFWRVSREFSAINKFIEKIKRAEERAYDLHDEAARRIQQLKGVQSECRRVIDFAQKVTGK